MAEAATGKLSRPESQEATPPLPGEAEVLARAGGENFSVASRLLPRAVRSHLLAVYGYARLVDEIGDAVAGDRLAQLDRLEADVRAIYAPDGEPVLPVCIRLTPTVRELDLPPGPFLALIDANRRDQEQKRYPSFPELVDYCTLSANPVGELVLRVFGVATPERIALSDAVCTALQLAEHWQDVGEDFAAGRVYLPADDLARFGVGDADLGAAHASEALRRLLAFEVARARDLLDQGAPLIATLSGSARVAVAGYVGGGRAALEAIDRTDYDVLAGPPRATRAARARHSLIAYRRRR